MAFQLTPLHIPNLTTNYSAENQAFANLGQTLGNLIPDLQKQRLQQQKQQILGQIGKGDMDFDKAGRGLIALGDTSAGATLLTLGQKAKERDAESQFFKNFGLGGSAPSTAGVGPASLIQNESGGNWGATNDAVGAGGARGHFGRAQFGQARIQDAVNAGALPPGTTPQQFTQSPELQKRAEAWHFGDIDNFIQANGYDKMIGQSINGVPVTVDGMRAVAHLGGTGGLRKFLESGGQYNPADRNGTSLMDYFSRHGGNSTPLAPRMQIASPVAAPQPPVQVAETEADVQRLEQEQAARGQPVQVAQAPQPGAPVADAPNAPAPGAVEAQGFAIPGTDTVVPQSLMNDPQVQRFSRLLMVAPTERARAAVKGQLDLAIKDAERRQAQNAPTEAVRNYRFYRQEEQAAGRTPMSFQQFRESTAARTNVNMPPAEKEYDKQSAKDFAELNRDVAKRGMNANGKIATLNRLESLLSNPNVKTGAGAQAALTLARAAKSVFGIDTEGLGPAEAVNAIANGFALELRNPSGGAGMPGALSDKDREFLMSLTPGLERTSEGNKLIIDYMRRLAKRDIEIEGLRRDYIKQNKRLDDGFYEKLADFSEKNPLFPEAAQAAPATRAPASAPAPQQAPQPRPSTSGPITATHPQTGKKLMLTPNGTWEPFDG